MSDPISIQVVDEGDQITITMDDAAYTTTTWGQVFGTLANQTDLKAALDAKVDDTEVATTATANKLLKLDANGDLPADITGNAATATEVAWTGISGKPSSFTPAAHLTGSHSDWPTGVTVDELAYLDGVTSNIQTQLNGKEATGTAAAAVAAHAGNTGNPHSVTAAQVGLGNVTNAAQVLRTEMGAANGVATLDAGGKVPTGQLPASLELGETSATAYRGDRGKIAYDHSQAAHAKTTAIDATDHALIDHTGMPGVPAAYTLPTASTTVLGGVKVDGTSINITDGVISAAGTGSGDVVGPAGATDNNIAVFDGITGKLIKDSGVSPSSFETVGAVSGHTSTFDHTKLHDAVTVADSTSIDLTLTGQQISAAAIFGTTAGTVCQGNDSRLSDARTPASHDNTYHSETYITSAELSGLLDETAHDLLDHTGLTGIPAAYNLPTASTTVLGGVKIDGTTITIADGVISAESGSGQAVTVEGTLALYVTQQTTLTITNYDSATSYSVNAVSGSASITGDTITYTAGNTAGTDTLTITAGSSSRDITITVNAAGIATPTNSTPTNGATDQSGPTLALSASAFSWTGLEDTHASSDWELATDSGFTTIVDSSYTDTSNKTSWTADVSTSQTYYWRVKYRGASGRESAWSTATSFTTKSSFGGLIGTAGAQGFGVGVYNGTLPSGFSAMTGTTDPVSDNYGNYQYSDGSVMCFVPRFYYRIGSASSPRYATYGANAVDIVGIETFADEAAANAAGYAMHRAFIDGGSVKSGFFIDKYLCSPNGTTSGKSVKNGVPISLTTTTTYTRSATMTGCTGILADAVILSRARGAGFNTASIFMYSALALLSLAHGQAATAATYCAWHDAAGTTNFPKGCNNGSLADHLDATVTFTTAGDSGSSAKPLTGSASNLAKTTHNGQNCGVADLNGAMYQVMLGLTDFGTSATDTTAHANGNVYLLKTSVALSSLTAGWDGATDAWGNTTSLATKYDAVTGLLPWGATTGWLYMGNGTNRVLDPATSGAGYQRTSCGIPQDTNAISAGGTNLYGNDGQYQYNRANLFPIASGNWVRAANAGLFYRGWNSDRSNGNLDFGFRASAYGA